MGRITAVALSVAALFVPVGAAWLVWAVDPRGWLPVALIVAFILWCIWARVDHAAGAFARSLLWLLIAAGIGWNPVLAGVAPVWAVPLFLGVFAVHWWAALRKHGTFPTVRWGDDEDEEDDETPPRRRVPDLTKVEPTRPGPLREPERVVRLPLGVDRVAKPTPPPPGIAALLLEAWPGDAKALHLDEVADLLTMSGATTRDVRDALTGEGVRVTDRVGKRRDGRSVTKPGVRWEDVQVASQHQPDPSRGVTTS